MHGFERPAAPVRKDSRDAAAIRRVSSNVAKHVPRPLFDDYDVPIDLDLLEQRSFESGVTMHHYAIRDAKEASSC